MAVAEIEDIGAERVVLSGIATYGGNAYIDATAFCNAGTFNNPKNRTIFKCFEHIYKDSPDKKIDIPTIFSAARDIGEPFADTDEDRKYIKALMNFPVSRDSIVPDAARIFKLSVVREADRIAAKQRKDFRSIIGSEPFGDILAKIENPIFDFVAGINDTKGEGFHQIARGVDEWLDWLEANPRENIGVPTPFATYNAMIGGGYRRSTVSIVGARPKTGKTVFGDNVALHVAGTLGLPVFNLDTEMTSQEHLARILAHLTGVSIKEIESGKFGQDAEKRRKIREAAAWLKTIPYYYEGVLGKSFEEHIASIRRWVIKTVPTDENGIRGDCLVVYDYLQLTDQGEFKGDFKEYQILGFNMLSLLRVASRCDIPILSLLQVNRDGIEKETTAVAAGSDRIIWKCANFSLLKRKSEEEIGEDGADEGTLKLVPLIARHGEGAEDNDYINIRFAKSCAKMEEGRTRFAIMREQKEAERNEGFVVDRPEEEIPFLQSAVEPAVPDDGEPDRRPAKRTRNKAAEKP